MSIMQGDKEVANVYNINNNSYSVPIGCIIPFSGSTIPVGFLLCDGSEVSKIDYADLYAIIADTYGTATDTAKFKLPDLRDRFVQGANGNLGTSKTAGLPNITGKFYHDTNAKAGLSGAFTYEGAGRQNLMNDTPTNSGLITFDASKSNSIYGNSDTVQPPSVCLTFIIKALKVSDQYADAVGTLIDDSATNVTDKTWSAKKISDTIDTSKVDAYTKSEADDMFAGKNDTHTHSNKAVLDKLSESDGKPKYDGTEIVTVSGTTMTGSLVAQANTDYTVAQVRNATMSDADPTGGSNGQIHYKYS